MAIPAEEIFPEKEYRARIAAVQKELDAADADALLVYQTHNIFFLCGYHAVGTPNYQFLLVPRKGDPTLLCRGLEKKLADYYATWLKDVFSWEDTEEPVGVTKKVLEARGLASAKVGYEGTSNWLLPRVFDRLQESIPDVKWKDLGGAVEKGRLIKSPLEIDCIRKAARFTEAGVEQALNAVREGATENDVAAAAVDGLLRAGSEYCMASPTVNSGPRSSIAHTSFRRRKLERGDTVLIELSGIYNRYVGPLMRSAVIGPPSEKLKGMYDACVEGLEAAIAKIKPGVTSGEVDEACTSIFRKKGLYDYYKKRLGYSVGIGFVPGWGEGNIMDLKQNDPRELKPGMVFHMPPALRVGDDWGFGVSETILVTDSGCELITNYSRELAVR